MKSITTMIFEKKLWQYPLIFGVFGALIGLILRYAYTGVVSGFPFKNVLHSHSHVMLLGFLFNTLLILVWTNFTQGLDKISYKYYLALQVCVAILLIAFILQGYALYSIVFSTLHLILSYIVLIRLWKRLTKNNSMHQFVKLGIIFHFISSIGPYMLGPLMVLEMQESPWYQQAIFFYLHFQYFGVFFVWMLAVLLQKANVILTKNQIVIVALSLVFLFAHSLDYSFNHWSIQVFGSIGSIGLLAVLLSFKNNFKNTENQYKYLYYIVLFIGIINIIGSIPSIANVVVENRFLLIAWLHLLFLGMYIPFIWINLTRKIHPLVWFLYSFAVLFSEVLLVFPTLLARWFSISVMWLLFFAYLGVSLCICYVHIKVLLEKIDKRVVD